MSLVKVAIIVAMVSVASLFGVYMLSSSHDSPQPIQQSPETMGDASGKHFSLDLNESVNVKGSP